MHTMINRERAEDAPSGLGLALVLATQALVWGAGGIWLGSIIWG